MVFGPEFRFPYLFWLSVARFVISIQGADIRKKVGNLSSRRQKNYKQKSLLLFVAICSNFAKTGADQSSRLRLGNVKKSSDCFCLSRSSLPGSNYSATPSKQPSFPSVAAHTYLDFPTPFFLHRKNNKGRKRFPVGCWKKRVKIRRNHVLSIFLLLFLFLRFPPSPGNTSSKFWGGKGKMKTKKKTRNCPLILKHIEILRKRFFTSEPSISSI